MRRREETKQEVVFGLINECWMRKNLHLNAGGLTAADNHNLCILRAVFHQMLLRYSGVDLCSRQ